MRQRYDWYVPPNDQEIDRVWRDGILTLDTNVLLDLYRYHEQTRQELLGSLEAFRGRVWLVDQVAEEFISNRTGVIASAAKTFREAEKALETLQKSAQGGVETLTSYRLIPRPLIEALGKTMTQAVSDALAALQAAEAAYPNYFRDDPILEQVLTLFTGAVGAAPTPEELDDLHKEGEERRNAQIPPGYLDKDKDGKRPFGDFILWRQVLLHAKSRSLPIVFVTSERKEDWWEEHSGKRIGPRRELLREANQVAAQRILIYQTDQFVQLAATRKGKPVTEDVVREIREISSRRRDYDTGREPAVAAEQTMEAATSNLQVGQLKLKLLRPVYTATGSGRLDPTMDEAPNVWVDLLSKPDGAPPIRVGAGAGTTFDFNVHLKSATWGTPIPVGEYVLRYTAQCGTPSDLADPDVMVGAADDSSAQRLATE